MSGQFPTRGTGHPENGILDDLAIFAAVARHGSFVLASKRIGIPTSSVSRAVARIESRLAVRLLVRTTRAVALTDEGRKLCESATPHLEALDDAIRSSLDSPTRELSGHLRVTAPAFTGATRVTRALGAFGRAHPNVTIEVDASNVHRDLVHDGYDFGIRVGPNVDADFVARRLWSGAFGLFASKAFVGRIGRIGRTGQGRARSSSPAITRQVLETGPCLGARVGATWRFRDAKNRVTEVKPSIRFAVNDPRAVISAAARGLGIALAPVDAATGDVVALRTDFGDPEPLDLYLVYPARRLQPRRVREAIQWLIDRG